MSIVEQRRAEQFRIQHEAVRDNPYGNIDEIYILLRFFGLRLNRNNEIGSFI